MIKLFTLLALISFSLSANVHVQIDCEDVYEKCAIKCEEKNPNDETCYAKCEIKFDECISMENQTEENSEKNSN